MPPVYRPLASKGLNKINKFDLLTKLLDYSNSVLAGMSDANFKKLECVQYALARAVTGMPVYSRDHMIPVLCQAALATNPRPGLIQDRHDGLQVPTDGEVILPSGTHRRCCSIKDTTIFSKSSMYSERI